MGGTVEGAPIELPDSWDQDYEVDGTLELKGREWYEAVVGIEPRVPEELSKPGLGTDELATLMLLVVSDRLRRWVAHASYWGNPNRPVANMDDDLAFRLIISNFNAPHRLNDDVLPFVRRAAVLLAGKRDTAELRDFVGRFDRVAQAVRGAQTYGAQMEHVARQASQDSWAGLEFEVKALLVETHALIYALIGDRSPPTETAESQRDASRFARSRSQLVTQHSEDFSTVIWHGQPFAFGATEARCVQALWAEWEKGDLGLREDTIGERISSQAEPYRLSKTFRQSDRTQHPAWGTMIVQVAPGVFALAGGPPQDA